jgi:hypothetical protein
VNLLNDACLAVIESGGYRFDPDCDEQGLGKIIFRDDVDPDLLRRVSTYFGEVVGNLWAARNYVVWHLACLREGTETPSHWKNLGFPIFPVEPGPTETFWGRAQRKLKGLDRSDVAKIEAVQPYQTGNQDPVSGLRMADTTDPHYVLEELAILDRHRRLAVTGLFPVFMEPDVKVISGDVTIASINPHDSMVDRPLKDGDVMATFIVKGSPPYEFAASPGAMVQIFPRDVLTPSASFDVWVRRMQACVSNLIDDFAAEFGEDRLDWTPPAQLWVPTP